MCVPHQHSYPSLGLIEQGTDQQPAYVQFSVDPLRALVFLALAHTHVHFTDLELFA